MTQEKAAIISTGSKQYRVSVGDVIDVELLEDLKEGSQVEFKEVLFARNGDQVHLGAPFLKVVVKGEVLGCIRGPKEIAYKYKKRKNYRRKVGHRQNYNRVKVTEIVV